MPRKAGPTGPVEDQREREIRRLRDELWRARHTIFSLMPSGVERVIHAIYRCESLEDLHAWERWAVREFVSSANKKPAYEMGDDLGDGYRAYCPLCGGSAQSAHLHGFLVPAGLERHLRGTKGARRCNVMHEAYADGLSQVRDLQGPGPHMTRDPSTPPPWAMTQATVDAEPTPHPRESGVVIAFKRE